MRVMATDDPAEIVWRKALQARGRDWVMSELQTRPGRHEDIVCDVVFEQPYPTRAFGCNGVRNFPHVVAHLRIDHCADLVRRLLMPSGAKLEPAGGAASNRSGAELTSDDGPRAAVGCRLLHHPIGTDDLVDRAATMRLGMAGLLGSAGRETVALAPPAACTGQRGWSRHGSGLLGRISGLLAIIRRL